jgi:hypothetical protein
VVASARRPGAALAYTAGGVAAPETTTRGGRLWAVWLVALPLAAYAIALAAVSAAVPYRPALDDPELLSLARHFAEHGRLDPEGLFRRVPLWQMLLGLGVGTFDERAAVIGLQAASVLAVLLALASRVRSGAAGAGPTLAVGLVFALSPQALLYSRHAANELFIGALAILALLLAERAKRADWRRAATAGAVVGAAAMTKLAAVVLLVPALWTLVRERSHRAARLGAFAGGFAVIAIPLVLLAVGQRGWPLDDTSSFNLGSLDQEQWLAAGSVAERNRLALESFEAAWDAGAAAYLSAAAGRAAGWLARPSSLDLIAWIPEYPPLVLELADQLVFFGVAVLAVLGTRRATLPTWLLPLALWAACSLPQKTPYSPRVAALLPLLLLAPIGIDVLRGRR